VAQAEGVLGEVGGIDRRSATSRRQPRLEHQTQRSERHQEGQDRDRGVHSARLGSVGHNLTCATLTRDEHVNMLR